MRLILLTLLALTFAAQPPTPARAVRQARHPALTLVSRVTVHKPAGKEVSEAVRYVSSDGSVRDIYKGPDGSVSRDYLYEAGRGSFYVSGEKRTLTKTFSVPPEASDEPLPTAEQLRAAPNFIGTEQVLGHTTYILRETHRPGGPPARDHYFAPELGRTPLKTVRYSGGAPYVIYEPVSLKVGEPDAALFKAPEGFEVRPMAPIIAGVLNGKAVSKPNPVWPPEARGVTGTVTIRILVDEEGKVAEAEAVSGPEQLRQAAVDAARKARFTPTKLSGQPARVQGTLVYNFVRQ